MKLTLSLIGLFLIVVISLYNIFNRDLPSTQISAFTVLAFTVGGLISIYISYIRKNSKK